jgi:hypothetical protein
MKQFLLLISLCAASLTTIAQKDLNIYVFLAEECPISIYMARPLKAAVEQFDDKVNFYAVFPNSNSTQETTSNFLEKYGLTTFKSILDTNQELTQKLGGTVTPEVAITNKTDGELLYRGRISNAYAAPSKMRHGKRINDLINMLTRIEKGEKIAQPWLPAVGCFITFQKS